MTTTSPLANMTAVFDVVVIGPVVAGCSSRDRGAAAKVALHADDVVRFLQPRGVRRPDRRPT